MRMNSRFYSNGSKSNTDHYCKILRVYYSPDTVRDILHTSHLYPDQFYEVLLFSIYR